MKEKYISLWRHSLEHSKKLDFYKVFKDEYSTSDYLQFFSIPSNGERNLTESAGIEYYYFAFLQPCSPQDSRYGQFQDQKKKQKRAAFQEYFGQRFGCQDTKPLTYWLKVFKNHTLPYTSSLTKPPPPQSKLL